MTNEMLTPPRQKSKILILGLNYSPEKTGIAPYTSRLAERLLDAGHDVQVITGYPHYPEWKLAPGYTGWQRRETINSVPVKRLRHYIPQRVTNLSRIFMEVSFGFRLFFSRWGSPDIVLAVTPALLSTTFVAFRARFGFRRPVTGIWVQDLYSRGLEETGTGNSATGRLMKLLEGQVLRSATAVTVIHDRFKEYVVSTFKVPEQRVGVIRNWTHVQPQKRFDRVKMRSGYGWSESDVIVLHAGNIGVKQGLENVVAAARLATERQSKVRFVLLGDGNRRHHIQNLGRGLAKFQLLPPLPEEDFIKTLHSADVLLVNEMAGLREMAVPSKLTTYFSTGLPVIAATEADSTTANEIDKSAGGVRVNPDLPEELLTAAENLGSNKQRASDLGQAGLQYAQNSLSQEAAIFQYSEWLHELASENQRVKSGATAKSSRRINEAGGHD